jgi:hypothetical protein
VIVEENIRGIVGEKIGGNREENIRGLESQLCTKIERFRTAFSRLSDIEDGTGGLPVGDERMEHRA